MIWDILSKKIEDADLGEVGKSLFLERMGSGQTKGIILKGPPIGIKINPYLPGYYKPRIQTIIRHSDIAEGIALADQVMNALWISKVEQHPATAERGAVELKQFYPDHHPIQYPAMEGDLIEWSINFSTAFSIRAL